MNYKSVIKKLQKDNLINDYYIKGPYKKIEDIYNLSDMVVLPFKRPYWFDPPLTILEAISNSNLPNRTLPTENSMGGTL